MKKLSLIELEKHHLDSQAMNAVKGGKTCGCSCAYEGKGGSSTNANGDANLAGGLWSPDIIESRPDWKRLEDGTWTQA